MYTVLYPLDRPVEYLTAGFEEQASERVLSRYLRLQIAVSLLFWTVIYLVKFAFLLFYRFLFGVSKSFMQAWWTVSIITVLTFLICLLSVFWACEAPQHLFVLGAIPFFSLSNEYC